mmetsp:Transcript_27355/g.56460  ORF Transcript_27355/g.56460 Transcript_27355/m.56460 type:complete len:206 (+) Transcript_27355:480-1097(+)
MLMVCGLPLVQSCGQALSLQLGKDLLFFRGQVADQVSEAKEVDRSDDHVTLKSVQLLSLSVGHLHRWAAFDLSDAGAGDVRHLFAVPLFHLQPQGLPSVLQQGQARVGRTTQDGTDGIPGDVRMVPPKEVERRDLIQHTITLDLLAIDEDGRQDFQAVLFQKLLCRHVDPTPVLWFGRHAIGVSPENLHVNLQVFGEGHEDGNAL